ncbi:MAG TPA: class I SAM-dependent RNA methyltransferase [Blastocatellia bacterium]|nr:class I SAM-dependent RNA methyltransferase [Blastocatellia bacterium]
MTLLLGDIHDITIEKIVYGGDGLGRVNGQTVFVPFAAPGDQLRVRITKLERNFARGEIVEITTPSTLRRAAPCPHFGVCGGCQLQHLQYDAQRKTKAEFIRESLRRMGGIDWQNEIEVLTADEFGYRARAEIKVRQGETATGRNGEQHHESPARPLARSPRPIQIGFFKDNSHEICEVTECPILLPAANAALRELHQPPNLLTSRATRVYLTVGDDQTLATPATGENARDAEIDAQGTVQQTIAGINYRFGVRTFFQSNRLLVERLVTVAIEDANGKVAFDLYAGAGLFSLQLAKLFAQVYAVEGSKISSQHGIQNAQANRIHNVNYEAMSVEAWLKFQASKLPRPDFVLLDPPRAGAGEAVVQRLIALASPRIHYVSCDPTTLVRDLKLLTKANYKIDSITALDMFPQTYHIETVVKLTRT